MAKHKTSLRCDGCKSHQTSDHPRGIVLVLMLLGLVLIASLLFYVLNLGKHVNSRIVAQHSADAAATAGATWMARTFNAVAQNNLTTSRYLADINVLTVLPTVTAASHAEQQAYLEGIGQSLGHAHTSSARLNQVIEDQLTFLHTELTEEVALLQPVDQMFAGYDLTQDTSYPGPMWSAMKTLEQTSVVMLQSLPQRMQQHGDQVGMANLVADGAKSASVILLPIEQALPFRYGNHPDNALRTRFDDFQNAVTRGRLPDWQDHAVVNRGPFDTVFGWRSFSTTRNPDGGPASPGSSATGGINSNLGGSFGGGPSGHALGPAGAGSPAGYPIGYRTTGMLDHAIAVIANFCNRQRWLGGNQRRANLRSDLTRYAQWTYAAAWAVLNYLWPDSHQVQKAWFSIPRWTAVYPTQVANRPEPIPEMAYFRLDIKSRYPWTDSRFMASEDSWAFENDVLWQTSDPQATHFVLQRPRRWWARLPDGTFVDYPHQMNEPGVDIRNIDGGHYRMWQYAWPYKVLFDQSIGIEPVYDEDDEPVPQDAYFVQILVYAAINENPIPAGPFASNHPAAQSHPQVMADRNQVVPLVNPFAGLDHNNHSLPAPVLLDTRDLNRSDTSFEATQIRDQIQQYVKDHLSVLAAAGRSGRAMFWPSQFDRTRPTTQIYGIAKAVVFNHHSFDLWTPMWKPQLQTIADWNHWAELAEAASHDTGSTYVQSADLERLSQYLQAAGPLAAMMQ